MKNELKEGEVLLQLPEGKCPYNVLNWLSGDHSSAMGTLTEFLIDGAEKDPDGTERDMLEAIQIIRAWALKTHEDTHKLARLLTDANRRIETLQAMVDAS